MRMLFSLVVLFAGAQASGEFDTCSNVRCSISFSNPATGESMDFGEINHCACLSQITSLVKSDSVLSKAASVVGDSQVADYISDIVQTKGETCNYPDHATLKCTPKNPCDFDCGNGYTPAGGKCVCKPPYTECDGECGDFYNCPSKSARKRDADEWKRKAHCDGGYTACGVYWSSRLTSDAYECVDTKNDLESCGGCSIPLHRGSPLGTDCTSLPGVADVSCMKGSCYVHKCMPGYQLAVDNSMCMDDETVNKFTAIAEFGWGWDSPVRID